MASALFQNHCLPLHRTQKSSVLRPLSSSASSKSSAKEVVRKMEKYMKSCGNEKAKISI